VVVDKTRDKSGSVAKAPAQPKRVQPKSHTLLKGHLNAHRFTKAPEPQLTGRQRKDLAMIKARVIATKGGYTGWKHVLETYEDKHPGDSSLRLWAGASARWEIDSICERWRRAQPKRR